MGKEKKILQAYHIWHVKVKLEKTTRLLTEIMK